jgi:molybdopterin molybdotransferase
LTEKVAFRPNLSLLLPVRLECSVNGQLLAQPLPTNTSGDFSGLIGTSGFIELPASAEAFPSGFVGRFYSWA